MSPAQHLREFIRERLTAAAEEIFTEVEKNIEEEIDRQRKLLEISWKPRVQLHRIAPPDVPQQHVSKGEEEAVPAEQQLCSQQGNSSMDELEPESLHVKEEQEDLVLQEEEQLVLKHETDSFSLSPTQEQNYDNDPESDSDDISPYTCPVDEHLHLEQSQHEDPGPANYAELNPDMSSFRNWNDNEENDQMLESNGETDDAAEKMYMCGICKKRFCYHSSLQKHYAVHKDQRLYACKSCGKRFNRKDVLLRHMRTHTHDKPHSCNICGKSFVLNAYLLSHMRTHKDERPYSCELCGKCFGLNATLMAHLKTHTGEKPYSCKSCGKCFGLNASLLSHMRTHTGEKPYTCKICGKCFSRNSNLLRHMKIHTGEKPHRCKTCGKCFSRNCDLLRHIGTHTEDVFV